MSDNLEPQDVAARRRPSGIGSAWAWLVDGMAAAGTAMIVVLMVIICSDVVARNLMGASLPLVSELGALTLVMIVYLQLATAIRHNRLARADIFIDALQQRRPRAATLLNGVFELVGAGMLALVSWSTIRILESDIARGEYIGVTGVMTLPAWPFRAVILFGMTVACIQFVLGTIEAFRPDHASEQARS